MNDYERKQKVVEHWERMIKWVEKKEEEAIKDKKVCHISSHNMVKELGECADTDHCEFCKAYFNHQDSTCGKCPIATQIAPCTDMEKSGFPGRFGQSEIWLPKAKEFLKAIENLKVKPKSASIDWTKPLRDTKVGNDIISIEDVKMVKTKEDGFVVDVTGKGVFSKKQLIENIPEEENYKPIGIGDRVMLYGEEHILVSTGNTHVLFVNTKRGTRMGYPVQVGNSYIISLREFKFLIQGEAETSLPWNEVYKTLVRRT